VDAVSSFPYFDLPKDSPAFITSTNKLLGSLAGLAIVGVKTSEWDRLFQVEEESYLSLTRYKRFIEANQTPTTVGTYLFDHLLEVLEGFELDRQREKIERVSKLLCSEIGEEFVIGDSVGPVITVNANSIPLSLANKWNLYAKTNLGGVYQIFTYSCEEHLYEEFITELKLERHV
jgi:aspartate aminotransferase-like enzyme